MKINKGLEVTRNIKIIEWLKTEILSSVSALYDLMFNGARSTDEVVQDVLANIIMTTYLLSKRLGLKYSDIDNKIKEKIKAAIIEEHKIEKWYGDLSTLKEHIKSRE
ncbi:MazG-like family protein [Alkalithermobacter thermoalcaliphilus JW-YL-7 = DSM 7308]|uniref:MazG-like domain containing protein n=1 Tax=Alkalithermobacter thermoalcaliphilus JW-YL-7 = DSM 7308 TaxID=1121328 RepID=A0A150FT04_CLOPD|nr:MazG-like domain containing protein [[Clostridium] paradoxum JW-YL-7 = DSM 7308]SHL09353.1 MazG-like family protein [[Clostridium] paradoxum JW-YL-7 = DSM 7308]